MNKISDHRPPVAIGHVRLLVNDVAAANKYFEELGLRPIALGDNFSVMELRGGTHLILSRAEAPIEPGTRAAIDLMVDDVDAARREYAKKGFETSEISRGSIHDTFTLLAPDGYEIRINSSHAGDRAV